MAYYLRKGGVNLGDGAWSALEQLEQIDDVQVYVFVFYYLMDAVDKEEMAMWLGENRAPDRRRLALRGLQELKNTAVPGTPHRYGGEYWNVEWRDESGDSKPKAKKTPVKKAPAKRTSASKPKKSANKAHARRR